MGSSAPLGISFQDPAVLTESFLSFLAAAGRRTGQQGGRCSHPGVSPSLTRQSQKEGQVSKEEGGGGGGRNSLAKGPRKGNSRVTTWSGHLQARPLGMVPPGTWRC